jgi:hypothetical protein
MARGKLTHKKKLQIIYLKSRKWQQSRIAQEVGMSAATVCRVLDRDSSRYLRIPDPEFRWEAVTAEQAAELRALDDDTAMSKELEQLLKIGPAGRGPTVRVIPTGEGDEARTALEMLCSRIALPVRQLLAGAGLVGVTWGRGVARLCDSLAATADESEHEAQDTQVIPLCGESLGATTPSSMSSSVLAERLDKILAPDAQHKVLSLGMIPVFLPGPGAFNDGDVASALKLFSYSVSYTQIFGTNVKRGRKTSPGVKELPLAERLDAIVTSISREGNAFGFAEMEHFTWRTLKLGQLAKLLLGDIGGVPLRQPRLSDADQNNLENLYSRWTGLNLDHFLRCAERGYSERPGRAGVIVFGDGADRAKCIIEAVKLGIINHLFVDLPLNDAIRAELGSTKRTPAAG